ALQAARAWYASEEGRQRYQCRAGVEGTLSQGVRAFGLRQTRYRGLEKTHLQHVAIAAAINIDRLVAWLDARPRATTRTSRFAALAPACTLPAVTLPGEDPGCPPCSCDVITGSLTYFYYKNYLCSKLREKSSHAALPKSGVSLL